MSNLFGLIITTLVAHGLMLTSLSVTREFYVTSFYVTSLHVTYIPLHDNFPVLIYI